MNITAIVWSNVKVTGSKEEECCFKHACIVLEKRNSILKIKEVDAGGTYTGSSRMYMHANVESLTPWTIVLSATAVYQKFGKTEGKALDLDNVVEDRRTPVIIKAEF